MPRFQVAGGDEGHACGGGVSAGNDGPSLACFRALPSLHPKLLDGHAHEHPKSWRRTRREAIQDLVGRDAAVQELGNLGVGTEELASAIYERVRTEEVPNFLKHIRIDPDGGIDRISEMWDPQKVFWFFLLVASVLFNVASILALNWSLSQSFLENLRRRRTLVREEHVHGGLDQGTIDMFQHIQDPDSRQQFLTVAVVVATLEVTWVVSCILRVLRHLCIFMLSKSEYRSFKAVDQLMQHTLPCLATHSSVSPIVKVHPALVYSEYLESVNRSAWQKTQLGFIVASAWFLFGRLMYAAAGVCAFSVKLVATTLRLISTEYSVLSRWKYVLALLYQCMGCVIVEHLLKDRIFLFVFGGQDTDYQDDERALRDAYTSRVAGEIWKRFWQKGERFKAVVLLATLDHYDLQRLLIEDVDPGISPRGSNKSASSAFRTPRERSRRLPVVAV